MCNRSRPNNILYLYFPIQEMEEFKYVSEKNHSAQTPVQMLYELHTLSIKICLDTIIESPSTERDIWEHLDLTLKVGCFIFPSISLTIRNIWNVLFADYKNKSNRQSCVGENLFFLWLRSLALCPHFQAHHFLSTIIKVNDCFRALLLLLLWVVLSGLASFSVLMLIILTSSVSWKCVVLPDYCQLLCQDDCLCGCFDDKATYLFPWFPTQRYFLVTGTSFLQGFDYGPRSRQMRTHLPPICRHLPSSYAIKRMLKVSLLYCFF